jgi:gliding motility-associated-like protein
LTDKIRSGFIAGFNRNLAGEMSFKNIDPYPMKKLYSALKGVFLLAALILGSSQKSQAQSGTDFWFAPPYVTHLHNPPGGVPIYLLLSSTGAISTVTISIPANGGFTPIVVTIPASKSKRIDLSAFQSSLETTPTNTVLNTGLRIQATTPVTANYEEDNTNNPEDFALKGANALGTEFYIPLTNYAGYPNNVFASPNQAIASFDIVASQNGTIVTIYSPLPVDGHPALTQFSVNLNAGQTYSCGWTGANYQLPSTHPAGAAVHSNLPVAITVKDDSDHNPSGGCYDLIGDQIIPTNILGTDYVAVKGFLNATGAESLFLTATQNNTNIYIDGNATPIRTMFAGETFQIIMDSLPTATDNSLYVKASNPVYATHVTGFGCEMGSAILPPLNCAGSHQVNFVRSTNEAFYLTLLVHATAINNFTITGPGTATITPASFVTVPGTGGLWMAGRIQYTVAQIPVDSGFSVTNSKDVFALGIINGGGATGCRYGYFSEFVAPIVVNAGVDQTICANDTALLAGSVTGGSTSGIWTTSGSGTFLPNNTTATAKYVPSSTDIAGTVVTLTLTSTSICFPQQDQMLLHFTPAPTVNAGANQTVCKNNPNTTLNGTVTVATGGLWSGGAGVFTPSNTTLNAVYTPTAAEIAANTLVLTLTSTGNGTCHAVSNSTVITFSTSPTVSAGPNQTLCSNNPNATLSGVVTGATGGIWTGGGGSYSPSSTALNAVYTPSATEISTGNVTLTLTTTGVGNCNAVSAAMTITFTLPPTVNAGPDQNICKNNPGVTLNGSVTIGTGGSWTGGLGTFSPNNNTLNAIYTPTATEIASGSMTLTLTSTGNGKCSAVTDQMIINFTPSPTVNAGGNQTVCRNNPNVTLNGTVTLATGGIWSGGAGTYNPGNTTLNAVYTPSAAELTAGTATLTLTSTGNGTCTAVNSTMTITLTPSPVVNAGPDQILCGNNPNATLSGSVTVAGGGVWSGGAGSFSPSNTALNAIYTPTATEISSGSVILTLTSTSNASCNAVNDQVRISFTLPPTVNAGADRSVCANNATVTLNGSVTVASGAQWSGGLGTFTPNNSTLNAAYSPTAGEIASGSVTLTLTSTGNGTCNAVSSQMKISFTPAPTVSAGSNQTVCANNAATTLNGTFTGASGILWSGGAGTYAPNSTTATAVYTPSAAEKTAGTVTLTLTTTGNGTCLPVNDNMTITITPGPQVNAGTDVSACANKSTVTLSGIVLNAGGGTWSGGAGVFVPSNTALNATYTPTAGEITAGSVSLTLTSTANGTCNPVSDIMKITYAPSPIVNAGADQTLCANNAVVSLNGSVNNAAGGIWSGGLGTFSPSASALNASYAPTQTEINSGLVKLILTSSGNASCNAVSDTMLLHFTPAPTANAGTNMTTCANNSVVALSGSHTVSTGAIWSGGLGTYAPSNTNMNASYTPTAAEIAAGGLTLKLTTTGNGTCLSVYDSIIVTITPKPSVNAGSDQTVCVTNLAVNLSGSIAGPTNTGKWTSLGSGTFTPSNTSLNATYHCSKVDSTNGFVKLVLSSTNNGSCLAVSDTMKISILPAGGANAGSNVTVCGNNATVILNGSITGGASSGVWSTAGTGAFTPNPNNLNAHYIPSAGDIAAGSVTLTLTANSCNPATSTMLITITPAPSVNAGPDQTVCSSNHNITLSGNISGGTTTGMWTTSGTGSFVPNNTTLNATYVVSSADSAAQIVHLVLHSTNNGSCVSVQDTVRINIYPSSTVNAGADQTVCANKATTNLNGSVSGGGPGTWSSSGTGVFNPDANTLNASYTPSAADIASGQVKLILSATSSCNAAVDFMVVFISPAPTANAGPDQSVCGSNPNVTLAGNVVSASGGIWSGGNGTFNPSTTSLNPTYTPTNAEISSGSLTLTLTTTGNGICNAVSDAMTITFTSSIVANAGVDQHVCRSASNAQLQGIISNGSSFGKWSTLGSGTFSPNDSTLNGLYQFSPADTSSGSVTLVLTSTHNGMCASANDTMKIIFGPNAFAYAGVDQVTCNSNTLINLNGLVSGGTSTGQWSTLGSGSFSPNTQTLNASYTLSTGDVSNGSVSLILSTTNNGGCRPGHDTVLISVSKPSVTNAGSDQTVCASSASVTLNGTVSGGSTTGQWTTRGSGSFSPNAQALHAVYSFGPTDYVSGKVMMVLSSTNNPACGVVRDTMYVSLQPVTQVNAGTDKTVCSASPATALNGIITGGTNTAIWSSNGTGSFSPNSQALNATYIPGSADLAFGNVSLILSSTSTGVCPATNDTMTIRFMRTPVANAGSDQVLCNGATTAALNGSIAGGTNTGIWSTLGSGIFSPNATTLNATYTPSAGDISAGTVKLVLESTNNAVCNQSSDTLVLTLSPATLVNAGTDQSVCSSNPLIPLNGTVQGGTNTGIWNTLGSGTFNPNAAALNATYSPSVSDIANGKVKLTLSSTNNGACNTVTDTMLIRFSNGAVANAGMDQSSCSGGNIQLNGLISGGSGTGTWITVGNGSFVPNATTLGAVYVPSQADRSAGSIHLVLVSTNNGQCNASSDTMKITFGTKPTAAFTSTVSGSSATFSDQSIGAVTWLWNFGNSGGLATQQNPVYMYAADGTYTVTLVVTNTSGCSDTAHANVVIEPTTIVISPVAVPTGFTPNGDGVNDGVMVLGGPFQQVELKIYNQWGNMVFSSGDAKGTWDGKYNGTDQPAGVYIFTAKGRTADGKEFNFSGDVTLIR